MQAGDTVIRWCSMRGVWKTVWAECVAVNRRGTCPAWDHIRCLCVCVDNPCTIYSRRKAVRREHESGMSTHCTELYWVVGLVLFLWGGREGRSEFFVSCVVHFTIVVGGGV